MENVKHLGKRWLAVVLALMLCLSLLGTTAFAVDADGAGDTEARGTEETEGTVAAASVDETCAAEVDGVGYATFLDAYYAVPTNGTINLLRDTAQNGSLGKTFTLNLNGHTFNENTSNYLGVTNGFEVTIVDTAGGGKITNNGSKYALYATNGGTLILGEGAAVESTFTAAVVLSGGNLVVDGGTVKNTKCNAVQAQSGSSVTVKGTGGVTATQAGYYAIKALSGSSVEVGGSGRVSGVDGGIYASNTTDASPSVKISGGTVKAPGGYGVVLMDNLYLDVTGGEVSGAVAVTTNGSESPNVVADISGGTLKGTVSGVYLPNGTLNVSGNAYIEGMAGIVVRAVALNVTGGTIIATGGKNDTVNVGDAGYPVSVAAITVDQNAGYSGGNVRVNIGGGTIKGPIAVSFTVKGEVQTAEAGYIVVTGGRYSDKSAEAYVTDESLALVKDDISGYYVLGEKEESVVAEPKPDEGTGATAVEVTPPETKVKDDTVTAVVSSTYMDAAVDAAVDDGDGTAPVVKVNVETADEEENTADSLDVTLPTSSLDKLADAEGSLVIVSKVAEVALDNTALKALSSEAAATETENVISLVVEPRSESKLPDTMKTDTNAKVVDVSLVSSDNVVIPHSGGTITVKLPYELKDGQVESNIKVYYLPDIGAPVRYSDSFFESGKVIFTTNHLSEYVIYDEGVSTGDDGPGDDDPGDDNPGNDNPGDDNSGTGSTGGSTGGGYYDGGYYGGGSGGGVTIEDEDVPLAGLPFTFTDVSEENWFYEAVKYVYDAGLMNGMGDNQFEPGNTTTRGQLMTILARMAGADTDGGSIWYEKGMAWAVENGVSDGSDPENPITREQLVTMLWRYISEPEAGSEGLSQFPDVSSVHDWAAGAMAWAVENGIIAGSDGKLNPQDNATRAEMATILMRFCEKYGSEEAEDAEGTENAEET